MKKPVILVIMDGYGIRKETYGNAIAKAKKPNLDKYFSRFPYTEIEASGFIPIIDKAVEFPCFNNVLIPCLIA
jgi:bisphosphoglycerate-independent phosphoglycerate mutase (AlkP superfamily)